MKNLHSWKNFYTTAGRDGRDKFQVWAESHELSLNVACFDILILELLFKDIVPFMCLILFSLKWNCEKYAIANVDCQEYSIANVLIFRNIWLQMFHLLTSLVGSQECTTLTEGQFRGGGKSVSLIFQCFPEKFEVEEN